MEFKHTNLDVEALPKLVRDNIPQIIIDDGREPQFHVADDQEFKQQLLRKIIEEAVEIQYSEDKEEMMKEMADIFELLDALIELEQIDITEIHNIREIKNKKNGGFSERYILESN